ncbi:MAG: CPBP family glutamic-type intramembrane protease [Bacteroidetes bacterium]|nr:CPBP family glutamic-type intramembrane protease [Bacteroidota bacterium]
MKILRSNKIYFSLILVLALFSALNVFLPYGSILKQYELPASKPIVALATFFLMLVVYGGLGFIGLELSKKLGFPEIWDNKITNKQRFLIPGLIGTGIGLFFILVDISVHHLQPVWPIPHPEFPASIVASITAGIGEEIMFRLFFISFWVWLLSFVIFRKKWKIQIFWVVAVFSAIVFAFAHMPSLMMLWGLTSIDKIPILLLIEIILLNGVLSLFAAKYFKKYGLFAAIGIHFWADIVWHVIYGLI